MKYPAIPYRSNYRHQIAENYPIQTPIRPEKDIDTKWVLLNIDGLMILKEGFGSDGTSFLEKRLIKIPFIGKKLARLFLKGSFSHDGFYYLFKMGKLSLSFRPMVDAFARELWIDSGIWEWVADTCLFFLKKFGGSAALPENKRPMLWAK